MKYLKSYKTKEEYVNDVRGGGRTHSLPNVALIEEDNKRPYYDIVRMSDNKLKGIWDKIKDKGWNHNTTSGITTQELSLITSDEFNSLNETEYQNRSKVWKDLKTFDEFKYFTGVDNINAAKKSSSGNRIGGFNGAKELESITLPSSLKEIGEFAFNMFTKSGNTAIYDTKLKHVFGGENVEKIARRAFQCCSALTEFNFSNKLTEIENNAFLKCYSLSHVSGGENVEKIGNAAFFGCSALTEFNFSDKLTKIGKITFNYCYNLQKAILPETIVAIHYAAFSNDTNLTNIGNLHNVKYIGDYAFDGWSVGVPANRLGTGTGMLNYDGSFDCQMPNLEEVGIFSFQSQPYLNELYMPKLRSIGPSCFWECSNLKKITTSSCVRICNSMESILRNVNGIEYDKAPNNCIIKDKELIPISSVTEWAFDDETRIPSFFLYEASNLSSVTIPNSVTSVGREAFNDCSNLAIVNGSNSFIGSGSTDIAYLFDGCKKIKELDLSNCDFSGIVNEGETNGTNSGLDYFASTCSSLTTIKLGKFNISGFTNETNYHLFTGDSSLKDIYITSDSPSLSFLESQCILSKIASNVTIHFGEELYTYNGSSWVKS